jgi:hypothetical protein
MIRSLLGFGLINRIRRKVTNTLHNSLQVLDVTLTLQSTPTDHDTPEYQQRG